MLPIETGWPRAADTCDSMAAWTLAPVRTCRASTTRPRPTTTTTAAAITRKRFTRELLDQGAITSPTTGTGGARPGRRGGRPASASQRGGLADTARDFQQALARGRVVLQHVGPGALAGRLHERVAVLENQVLDVALRECVQRLVELCLGDALDGDALTVGDGAAQAAQHGGDQRPGVRQAHLHGDSVAAPPGGPGRRAGPAGRGPYNCADTTFRGARQ